MFGWMDGWIGGDGELVVVVVGESLKLRLCAS